MAASSSPASQPFDLVNKLTSHLSVHPADAALSPPESYLFVQDGLVISCGMFWALAYLFYSIRCIADKRSGMPMLCLCLCPAWELFYGILVPSTTFEQFSYMGWFLVDTSFILVAMINENGSDRRRTSQILLGNALSLALLWALSRRYSDQHATAYFTGFLCQLLISWGSVYDLHHNNTTRGHSLGIWCMRFLGTSFAFLIFGWRFANVPHNWAYVGNSWSIAMIGLWITGDLVYPFIYYRVRLGKIKTT